jgi:type I restriction enzyme S subunit
MKTTQYLLGDVMRFFNGKSVRPGGIGKYPVYGSNGVIGMSDEYRHEDAIIIGRVGAYCGSVEHCKGPFWASDNTIVVTPRNSEFDTRFLYYLLKSLDLNRFASGAAQPLLTQTHLKEVNVDLPCLPTQQRISSILSLYDDLIANNTRRIGVLNEIAQTIYREWFANFRFPNHHKSTMVKSEVGPIPNGWSVGSLRDLCESVDYGFTASATKEPIGPKFLRITDIVPDFIDWRSVPHCPPPDKNPQKYRLLEGDIVVARTGATTGYAKRLNKRHPECIFASYLVRLRIKPEYSNHMIGLLVESDDYKRFIKANLGGAAQPQANAQVLTSMPIAIPPSAIQMDFSKIVTPLLDQEEVLQLQNENLRATRDLLLPKLMAGGITVETAEEEAVAQGV